MSQKGYTKDERFMVRLYEMAKATGDMQTEMNRYDVGGSVGINAKAVDTICNLLAQANFIKKVGKEGVYLTEHGENLVLTLLE